MRYTHPEDTLYDAVESLVNTNVAKTVAMKSLEN